MKDRSRERLANLLMDELLERLSTRESLLKMLGKMTSLPIDEVIENLLTDFERAVEEYLQRHPAIEKEGAQPLVHHAQEVQQVQSAATTVPVVKAKPEPVTPRPEPVKAEPVKQKPVEPSKPVSPVPSKPPKQEVPSSVQLDPIKLEFPKIKLKMPEPTSVPSPVEEMRRETTEARKERTPKPEATKQDDELQKLEDLAKKIESEYAARGDEPPAESSPRHIEQHREDELRVSVDNSVDSSRTSEEDEDEEIVGLPAGGPGKHTTRARYDFADDTYVYVHAASRIPEGESPMAEPFMLEEKGIDGHEFAFALDYSGMRFYLSRVNPTELNVSKAMVLLLNKQESIQLQGSHESTLNDLRAHGILLPLEFGTVARGKDSLLSVLDKNLDDLEEALAELEKTTWWTVTASVLDSTIARIVGTDVQTIGRDRSRNRASYTSSPQGKKFDIKVLERILQREKKLAEGVHTELSAVADRSNVDSIVGLGSGSSEDWKVILKASYEIPKRDVVRFNRAVTDLQYHHLQYDLMLAVAGKRDCIGLRRK